MAIDTRSRRASIIGLALAAQLALPLADGTVDQPDRQHAALCYPGIATSAAVASTMYADVVLTARADDHVVELQVDDYVVVLPSTDEVHEG